MYFYCWIPAVKESTALDVYGEWVPVDKTTSKTTAATNSTPTSTSTPTSSDMLTAVALCEAPPPQAAVVTEADCVFNDQVLQVSPRSRAWIQLYHQFLCDITTARFYSVT